MDPYSRAREPKGGDINQLDTMLGTLTSDMSKHGISTIPKGDCANCNKTIVGQVKFYEFYVFVRVFLDWCN